MAAGTVLAALVVAGIVVTRRDPPAPPAPVVTASRAVDQAPFPGGETRLPRLATALPPEIAIDPARAVPLSAAPVGRALALFAAGQPGPIYVLGDDGKLRVLDVVSPAPVADGSLGTTVLKPDGTQAAFPRRDHVVLVDLTTGTARQLRVPGRNERVLWQGEQLLVAQRGATFAVDPASGRATRRPYAGFGLVAGVPQGAPVLDLVSLGPAATVRSWSGSAEMTTVRVPDLPAGATWSEPAWAYRWQLALAARFIANQPAPDFTDRTESVFAIDSNTGTVIGKLDLTTGEPKPRPPGCCAVLGWLNQRAVLLSMPGDGHWILAWDPVTGQVFRIARITFPGTRLDLSIVDGSYL